jgi:peroxiredoxin
VFVETRVRGLVANRWVRALGVAVLVASWPACNRNAVDSHDVASEGEVAEADPAGKPANLDFTLKDIAGNDVQLASFKGKPLLVNMWATWCGPCKAEIPWLVELTDKYKAQGFTVVGISTDDTPEQIQEFAKEYKMNYPLLVGKDRADVAKAFGADLVLPVTWLIKRDGTVHAKVTGIHGKDWFDKNIQELF